MATTFVYTDPYAPQSGSGGTKLENMTPVWFDMFPNQAGIPHGQLQGIGLNLSRWADSSSPTGAVGTLQVKISVLNTNGSTGALVGASPANFQLQAGYGVVYIPITDSMGNNPDIDPDTGYTIQVLYEQNSNNSTAMCMINVIGYQSWQVYTQANPSAQWPYKYASWYSDSQHNYYPYLELTLYTAPVDGGWSDWQWSACDPPCGGGTQTGTRTCTNPAPLNGGDQCQGPSTVTVQCNSQPCPTGGGWSDWSQWSECSVGCGATGTQTAVRSCSNPSPQYGGQDCQGSMTQTQSCTAKACIVNGGWSDWSAWSQCDATCGTGNQTRTRTCTNPAPGPGGLPCFGSDTDTQACDAGPCPIDGGWSAVQWGQCSLPCGGGVQTGTRTCTNPAPQNGGRQCAGSTTVSIPCNTQPCVPDSDDSPVQTVPAQVIVVSSSNPDASTVQATGAISLPNTAPATPITVAETTPIGVQTAQTTQTVQGVNGVNKGIDQDPLLQTYMGIPVYIIVLVLIFAVLVSTYVINGFIQDDPEPDAPTTGTM